MYAVTLSKEDVLKGSTIINVQGACVTLASTRNILKKDIRRLSNTDDKRNQILWFRRNSNLPLRPLHAGI